jgi:two-component system sensor kinase FixL
MAFGTRFSVVSRLGRSKAAHSAGLASANRYSFPEQFHRRTTRTQLSMTTNGHLSTSRDKTLRTADGVVRRLAIRYFIVLFAVAALIVIDQSIIQPWLVRLGSYAPVINVAGRQRMLSQRLAKAALALEIADDATARRLRSGELRETLSQWSSAHAALRKGDPNLGIERIHSPDIDTQWKLLQPNFDVMCAAAQTIIGQPDADAGKEHLNDQSAAAVAAIVEHEAPFLASMDRIVKLMEGEAAAAVARLRICALSISAAVVLLILGLGWFVVRPATRTIRKQVDDLETRVALRTRELSAALDELRHEVSERELAESKTQRLAAQLAHAERVTTMGHLTAGLAHELNQPLAAIANYAEACDVELLSTRDTDIRAGVLRKHVDKVKQASLRAGQIVRRMRNFVRPNAASLTDVEANLLVTEIVELLRSEIDRAGVEVTLDLSARGARVRADSIQIQQVLVNLVQNALQAMGACPPGNRRLTLHTSTTVDTVQFDAIDSGPGFSPADSQVVFAPFQTGKPDGLGIGLAICRSIVEQHEGTIWIGSSVGQGATISFALPLVTQHDARRHDQSDCVCR